MECSDCWSLAIGSLGAFLQIAAIFVAMRPIADWWGFTVIWKVWRNKETYEDIPINSIAEASVPPDSSEKWIQVKAPRYVPAFTDQERSNAHRRVYTVAILLISGILLQLVATWWNLLIPPVGHVIWTGCAAAGIGFSAFHNAIDQ